MQYWTSALTVPIEFEPLDVIQLTIHHDIPYNSLDIRTGRSSSDVLFPIPQAKVLAYAQFEGDMEVDFFGYLPIGNYIFKNMDCSN